MKEAKPDFVWVGANGIDRVLMLEAMKSIDYLPPMHFYLFPAPGPMAKVPEARNALAFTTFEEHPPFTSNPRAASSSRATTSAAPRPGCRTTSVDLLASIAYAAWQVLEAAVTATKSLDDKALAAWLRRTRSRRSSARCAGTARRTTSSARTCTRSSSSRTASGRRPAEGVCRARREAELQRVAPSVQLLGQSILSGIFIGALYGLLGLGLSLAWGILRQINLAHFALAFLGAYLTYQLVGGRRRPARRARADRAGFLRSRHGHAMAACALPGNALNSLLVTFGLTVIIEAMIQGSGPRISGAWSRQYGEAEVEGRASCSSR